MARSGVDLLESPGPDALTTVRPARTRTRKFAAKRDAILRSAVEELNRKGVRGMTLGDIAARLNLVPTGVIYYFRNKEELAAEAFLRAIGRFDDLLRESAGAETDGARIAEFVRRYFAFKQDVEAGQADPIAIFNDVRALNSPPVNTAYVDMFRRARALLPGDAVWPRAHRNARAHLLLSQLFWAPAWLRQAEVSDYPRTAARLVDIMAHGLAAGGRWPAPKPIRVVDDDAAPASSSEQFLKAATRLINDEGYHGASVERISAQLNVSKGAFYHHNATKDELVVACFHRTFETMWRAIHEAEAAGGPALQVLVTMSSALIEHQMSGGAPLLRTAALTTVPEAIRLELIQRFDRISYRFASILCDGVADGSVRPVDVNIAAQTITAAINAAAELHFWVPGVSPKSVTDLYVRPLFLGLISPVPD